MWKSVLLRWQKPSDFYRDLSLIFFNSVRLIYMVRPAELLKGGQIGRKMTPKQMAIGSVGIVTLAGGYILALKADNVMTGLNTFFVAVLLVIVGTFFPVYGREHCFF